ncbi:MAG: hemerythrin domain-containing protein [Chloroflexia bacterium]
MGMVPEGSTHPQGEALLEELKWVHGIIRENLEAILQVAEDITNGAPAGEVQARLDDLASTSVIWRLRVDCMRYCYLVHAHHHGEDALFFPFLCAANPALRAVTDKLQADHIAVSDYLDKVQALSARIANEEQARGELAAALRELSDHLLTHLDYEEENLAPTLRRLKEHPYR